MPYNVSQWDTRFWGGSIRVHPHDDQTSMWKVQVQQGFFQPRAAFCGGARFPDPNAPDLGRLGQ